MNDLFEWTEIKTKPRRPSRKAKKRMARRERAYRRCMVQYAGHHLIHRESLDNRRRASAPAAGWASLRKVRVPRSLRTILGLTVAGKREYWRYQVKLDMGSLVAQYRTQAQVAAGDPAVIT